MNLGRDKFDVGKNQSLLAILTIRKTPTAATTITIGTKNMCTMIPTNTRSVWNATQQNQSPSRTIAEMMILRYAWNRWAPVTSASATSNCCCSA